MFFLGLDVGTTGCKAVIFTEKGDIVSSRYKEYPLYHRKIGWSELNPKEVWLKTLEAIRQAVKNVKMKSETIAGMSTSVLGDAFIPVDSKGEPLYWSMTTFDSRARKQTLQWVKNFGSNEMYKITGQPLTTSLPIYPLQKIQWLRDNKPEIYNKTGMFLFWQDYLNMKLCNKPVLDYSLASRTMMFDLEKKKWSDKILEEAGFEKSLFAEINPAGEPLGEINEEISRKTGLSKRTLVMVGGHDQSCGALGAGIIDTGPVMDATGTVECIGLVLKNFNLTDRMRQQGFAVHHYLIEDKYFMFGFNPTSGAVLKWFRDNFAEKELEEAKKRNRDIYEMLISTATNSPIGANGLFLLPYFEGSGTPHINRQARGVLLGLTLSHSKSDVVRSILEGLSYELRANIDEFEKHGNQITELRTIGGGAKSGFWLQMKADVTKRNTVVPSITEAAATGAAILATLGTGTYKTAGEAVRAIYKVKDVYIPRETVSPTYDKLYGIFKRFPMTLSEIYEEMDQIQ